MYKGHRIGVVVPVYNEESFVGDVLDGLPSLVDKAYPVDDCSTDGTWAEIQRRATPSAAAVGASVREGESAEVTAGMEATSDGGRSPGTVVDPIRHEENQGRGGAVKTGYKAALADGMDVVAVMDGDGQMDPDVLDRLLDPVVDGNADYAKGNRLDSPERRREMSAWRLFGNAVLTGLTRISSGYWRMTDPQNGYTAISSEALRRIDVDELYDGYGFLNDLLARLNVNDARIVDVSIPARYGDEESGIRYRSFVPLLSLLLLSRFLYRVRAEYLSGFHPVGVVYGLAALSGAGTFGYAIQSILVPRDRLQPLVTLGAVGVSVALVCVAFLVEWRANSDLEFDGDAELSGVDDRA